jgi:hypothetical protein
MWCSYYIYPRVQLGNLSSAIDDAGRASDLLNAGKFLDQRRLIAVANAKSQALIIMGSVSVAAGEGGGEGAAHKEGDWENSGDVKSNSQGDAMSTATSGGGKRRPSLSKTTLSRFFLHQHGKSTREIRVYAFISFIFRTYVYTVQFPELFSTILTTNTSHHTINQMYM